MKKVLLSACLIAACLVATSCGNHNSSSNSSQQTEYVSYKSFGQAINDGSISYGMTYSEIKSVCGPASDVSMRDGQVSHVRYGSSGTVYQVEFRGGRMWTYSEHNW